MSTLHDLPHSVQVDLNDLFVGRHIATGTYRTVFEHALDPNAVIKLEIANFKQFCNVVEWGMWEEARLGYPEAAQWLAPCTAISMNGAVLIQARTQPLKRMPKELPDFLADIKRENLGLWKGRVVAHDYGNNNLWDKGLRRIRMRPVSKEDAQR